MGSRINLVHQSQVAVTPAILNFIDADRFQTREFLIRDAHRTTHCADRYTVSQLVPKTTVVSFRLNIDSRDSEHLKAKFYR